MLNILKGKDGRKESETDSESEENTKKPAHSRESGGCCGSCGGQEKEGRNENA